MSGEYAPDVPAHELDTVLPSKRAATANGTPSKAGNAAPNGLNPTTSGEVEQPAPARRLDSLTGMRFLAALLVVLHHTVSNSIAGSALVDLPMLRPFASVGYVGVTFFFVLSGFVLTWSISKRPARQFYAGRVARIYPLYILTWALSFIVLWQLGRAFNPAAAVASLFLVQAWFRDPAIAYGGNSLGWTLSCEAFFYAMFPLLAFLMVRRSARTLWITMAVTVAALAAVPVIVYKGLGSRELGQYLHYFPAYRIGEFIVGICLALLVRHGLRWFMGVGATTLLAAVWFIGLAVLNEHASFVPGAGKSGLPQVAAGLAVLPIVSIWLVAAAGADLDDKKSFLRGNLLVRLGLWSFALYITHLIVLHELEIAIGHTAYRGAGAIALEIGALLLVIAVAGLVYEYIERPTERSLRRRLRAPSAAPTTQQ